MRAVQTKRFLYLFNPWPNGERIMATATSGTPTKRLERKGVTVSGVGVWAVTFQVPAEFSGDVVRFAAFIGEDHAGNLQSLQTKPVKVR